MRLQAARGDEGPDRALSSPAVFLDRDGVINENLADYVRSWDSFRFRPGALDAIRQLSEAGWPIVVVTNQSGIGRGAFARAVVDEIHERMAAEVAAAGGRLALVLCCPHHPDEGCECRKPSPGMLRQAARELDLDLARSYMVGDHLSDVDAGLAAGCGAILVRGGRGTEGAELARAAGRSDFAIVDGLPEAVDLILAEGGTLADP